MQSSLTFNMLFSSTHRLRQVAHVLQRHDRERSQQRHNDSHAIVAVGHCASEATVSRLCAVTALQRTAHTQRQSEATEPTVTNLDV